MSFSTQVQLPDWNRTNLLFNDDAIRLRHNQAVASDSLPQTVSLENQTSQQNLDDRSTLRSIVPGLVARTQNALATAASLPVGQPAVNALSTMDSQTATTKLEALKYSAGLPQMPYGGGQTNSLMPEGGPGGSSGQVSGMPNTPTGMPVGLGTAESGNNPAAVNKQGYSGSLQFGTGRLTDLNMYQPAQGENPNGNQWQGTITVPGFAPMSHQQFLQNPDAQRMAGEVHAKDIYQNIQNTSGAQDYNTAGLMAVAHLGGTHGMQQFVATGGKYNPHDSNGTSLQNYYDRFSTGGLPLMQRTFGHPDGPLSADHPARNVQVASAAQTNGIPATATDAVPVPAAGGTPPQGSSVADTPDQLQAKLAQMRAGGAPAPVPAPPPPDGRSSAVQGLDQFVQGQMVQPPTASQNQLTAVSAPQPAAPSAANVSPPSAPVQQAAPVTPQAAPAQAAPQPTPIQQRPFDPMAGLPSGSKPIPTAMGAPYTTGAPAGYAMAQTPPSAQFPRGQMVPYPLVPPVLKEVKTPNAIINVDPRTGQEVSRIAIPETGRMTFQEVPGGHQGFINGHPSGDVVPFSGRKEQGEAYQADQKTVAGINASAQAAQGVMPRLNEMAQIGSGLQTGLGGDFRAKAQAVLEQLGAKPEDAARITGISSAADADLYRKLATSTAGTAAKADMGANNGVEAMRIYQSANPSMNLQPDANKRITNMLRVQQQSTQDYAQAAMEHFGTQEQGFLNTDGKGAKAYMPLTAFNRQWQAQANPQVYAAATGILNGDAYAKWADKLGNPADAMRAASIASRIDPNVMVPIAGGKMQPARVLLGGGR